MLEIQPPSPRWSATTKLVVALIIVVLIGGAAIRFQFLVIPIVGAAMIAYLLHPIITFIAGRLKWPRALVSGLLYLLIILAVISLATGVGIYLFTQIGNLNLDLQQIVLDLPKRLDELVHSEYVIWGYTIDLNQLDLNNLYNEIAQAIQPAISQVGSQVGTAASSTAEFLGWMFFVLLISFYIVNDMPNMAGRIGRVAADPGYELDVRRLLNETQKIWNAFLRGQLTLALTNSILNWIGLAILGVRYSFIIGMLSGFFIFIPFVGPIAITAIAAGVALFQPDNWFGLDPIPYAGLVVLWLFITQQFGDYVLSPRIIGEHLELHPAVILVGTLMGASLGGFVGLLLAAPVLATLKLLGRYAWHKMLDMPPFDEDDNKPEHKSFFNLNALLAKLMVKRPMPTPAPTPSPQPLDEKADV
jgi:predicted PurR-regulated permease PerM